MFMIINFENIPIYSIFMILALIINCIIIFRFGKIQELDKNIIICSLTYEMIGMITGAKILNILQVKENVGFYYAGFSAYGGVIGAIIFLIIFSKLYKISIKKLSNIYIPILPLLYSISKLGCLFGGCCYGIKYSGVGSIIYKFASEAPLNVNLFPIQFIESFINLLIFIYIVTIYKKNKSNLLIIQKVFLLCGISKFILEFLRDSWNGYLSSTQYISVFFVFVGIFLIYYNKKIMNIKKE